MSIVEGFLLSRNWRDTSVGLEFEFWAATEHGPARIVITGQESVFFVDRALASTPSDARRAELTLNSLSGRPVDGLYFRDQRRMRRASEALRNSGAATYESDVKPLDRFLMERFVRGGITIDGEARDQGAYVEFRDPSIGPSSARPKLSLASMDIETSDFDGELYSIAVAMGGNAAVFMRGEGENADGITYHADERLLLEAFFDWMQDADPDVLIGWNLIDFDLDFLQRCCERLRIPFRLGRAGARAAVLAPQTARQTSVARVPGRAVLDGIALLRSATWSFERYSLEYVANELLGRGKIIHDVDNRVEEIRRLFQEDKPALAAYNLEDCNLVIDIFREAKLIEFAVERAMFSGLAVDRHGGSVAAFDYQYLPRLHRAGYVAPDVQTEVESTASPGGYVMDSKPGLYNNVLVLDFKSLYPSIIQTFKIDPLGMALPGDAPVPGMRGAQFHRTRHVLPGLIAELAEARERAKHADNAPLSQAIKIMMNSFYGVLGTSSCRFFHPGLVSSITERGHELIRRTRDFIESQDYEVIYGDTDSVFVHVGDDVPAERCADIGRRIARDLNAWWKETLQQELELESLLEIEFETHYLRFFMPTVRGSVKGSKKRYAGLIETDAGKLEVSFTGLENVRTDWTPLARAVQRELFERVFLNKPYKDYLKQIATGILAGEYDEQLVYRKRLRRKLSEYIKNVPPHVQAARKSANPGKWISYVITLNGPEPLDATQSPLDYAHYLDRQIAPVVDGLLNLFDTSFAALTADQMEMF